MATHALILWTVVFCVGIPCALYRNPTAAALVLSKIAGWYWHRWTGDNLPVEFYLFPDIFVIAVITAKHDNPLLNVWGQFLSVLRKNSPDRIVLLIFPLMWAFYLLKPVYPYYVWWSLWALVIAQFLAVGWEGVAKLLAPKRQSVEPSPIIDRNMVVVPFPVRRAEAVRKTPELSGALLTVNGGGGSG